MYAKYLNKSLEAINMLLEDSLYKYNNDLYNYNEGRINSLQGEKDFIDKITNSLELINEDEGNKFYKKKGRNYVLVIPFNEREWYDIGILYDGLFLPINIKITSGDSHDNLFGSKVLSYLLFADYNVTENGVHTLYRETEDSIATKIKSSWVNGTFDTVFNINSVRDYFFISIDKTGDYIGVSSALTIPTDTLKTNPKNLFQSNLIKNNYNILEQNMDFGININNLVNKFFEYTEKKASPYKILSGENNI